MVRRHTPLQTGRFVHEEAEEAVDIAADEPAGFHGGRHYKAGAMPKRSPPLAPLDDREPVLGPEPLSFDAARAIRQLRGNDRRLAALIDRVRPFELDLRPTQTTFHALAESIVYQQLSGRAAATIFGRLEAACVSLSPERLLKRRDATLRACGLSGAKLAALKDLAQKTLDGTVPDVADLHALDDDTIVERLTRVRGIGRWTVEMLLIFRLGRPDVLPIDDYGVRKGFAVAYRKKELPKPKELAAFGERWRPFRTVASWYLWRALDEPGGRT